MSAAENSRYDRRATVPFRIYESSQDSERLARDVMLCERELRDAKRFRQKLEALVKRVEALEQSLKKRKLSPSLTRVRRRAGPDKKRNGHRRTATAKMG